MENEGRALVEAMRYEPLRLPSGELMLMSEQDSKQALEVIMKTIQALKERMVGDVLYIGYYYMAIRDRYLWRHECTSWKTFCRDFTSWGSYEKVNDYINIYRTFNGHDVSGITVRKLTDIYAAHPAPEEIAGWLDRARNDQEKSLKAQLTGKTPPSECGHEDLYEYHFRKCRECGKMLKVAGESPEG